MTIKQFKKALQRSLDGQFVCWDNTDKHFESLEDNEMAIVGQPESETFAIKITKVKI